jgi:molybdenum cofactor cytidylyltransferase
VLNAVEDEAAVSRALFQMLRSKPSGILIASTTAPAGPDDVIGRAMARVECHIEKFLAPVEPGNLLLLAYKEDVPIVSAPGCFRSAATMWWTWFCHRSSRATGCQAGNWPRWAMAAC